MAKPDLHRRLTGVAVLGLAFGTPLAARAADPQLVETLAPALAKDCRPGAGGEGVIAAGKVRGALLNPKVVTLNLEPEWADAGSLGVRIAGRTYTSDDDTGPNADAYFRLRGVIDSWVSPASPTAAAFLPFADGGLAVRRSGGGAVGDREGRLVLAAILQGDDTDYVFVCKPPPQTEEKPPEGKSSRWTPEWALAKTPDDLGSPPTKKKYAEFTYLDDDAKNKQSYTVDATLGLTWKEFTFLDEGRRNAGPGLLIRGQVSAFAQVQRVGGDADETNNLNFGAQLGGFLQPRGRVTRSHYYSLTGRYLTDDDFDSRAWSVVARVTPDLSWPPGNHKPVIWANGAVRFSWNVSAVADWIAVDEAGQKIKWLTKPEYGRIGYDLDGELRWRPWSDSPGALSWTVNYALRDGLTEDGGDAQLLTSAILFEPTPNYAFGVVYQRGENLDSFEFSDQWKLTLGFRR